MNLADNQITDFGMHAVNNILLNLPLESINLASNMISSKGLEVIINTLCTSKTLKHLNLGISK